jgi:hypothetical protein
MALCVIVQTLNAIKEYAVPLSSVLFGTFQNSLRHLRMRISKSLSYALSASLMLTFVAGCSNGNSGGNSAFTPLTQTSSAQHYNPSVRLAAKQCGTTPNSAYPFSTVPLGTSGSFGALAGSTITSAGLSVVNGNLGVSPGTSITGFPPGIVNGGMYAGGPVAAKAEADLGIAYKNAVARPNASPLPADIGGMTITPGLYAAPVSLGISGTVTLNGQNHKEGVFIFQIPSTLTTAVNSAVVLTNNANACNIFWQVGSSATLNTASAFSGTIMAAASVSLGTGSSVNGRVLAESGAITLLDNAISIP